MNGSNRTFLRPRGFGIHRHWWSILPALPERTDTPAYRALKRVWADHTMNTITVDADGQGSSRGSRGVYRTDTEDHLTVSLFESWAAMPDASWVPTLLAACGAPSEGDVRRVGWSYAFEEVKGMGIADVVVGYEDDGGLAVVVIEAKKPGAAILADKDLAPDCPYFDLPSIRPLQRKTSCFLVDHADATDVRAKVGGRAVLTWQQLVGLQIGAAIRLAVPPTVRAFVVGSLLHHAAGLGIVPDPLPYGWLAQEPAADRIHKDAVRQPREDRIQAYWKQWRHVPGAPGSGGMGA